MNIKNIKLDDEGDPAFVTVRMSVAEAKYIALTVGKTNWNDREQIMAGGGEAGDEIYSELTGGFFNRFWDDGVNEA